MTRHLNVALVSEHASPLAVIGGTDSGGQNVHVAALARHLAALGCSVRVFTRRDDPGLPSTVPFDRNVDVNHVDAGPAAPIPKDDLLEHMPEFGENLLRAWSKARPDVAHSHFWMSGLATAHAAETLEMPWAHTFHALGVVKRRHQGALDTSPPERLGIESDIARRAGLLVATSIEECKELERMGAHSNRIVRIPCGVDLTVFGPAGPVARRTPSRRRVVVVSRLVDRKGINDVIDAMAHLPPEVELVIAGGPPRGLLESDPAARSFQLRAGQAGVADRVQLVGALGRRDIAALMRSADAVCCCPWYEPFGLVAVEAMACGVPVVATEVGGLAETVVHGSTGMHVPPRDPLAIAGALGMIIDDAALAARFSQRAGFRSRRYGWQTIAATTLAHLERMSTRSRASRVSATEAAS